MCPVSSVRGGGGSFGYSVTDTTPLDATDQGAAVRIPATRQTDRPKGACSRALQSKVAGAQISGTRLAADLLLALGGGPQTPAGALAGYGGVEESAGGKAIR